MKKKNKIKVKMVYLQMHEHDILELDTCDDDID